MSSKTVNTRELLRNFKTLKELLLSGRVEHIVIDMGNHKELELSVKERGHTGRELLEYLANRPKPIRPLRMPRKRIFDTLFS